MGVLESGFWRSFEEGEGEDGKDARVSVIKVWGANDLAVAADIEGGILDADGCFKLRTIPKEGGPKDAGCSGNGNIAFLRVYLAGYPNNPGCFVVIGVVA